MRHAKLRPIHYLQVGLLGLALSVVTSSLGAFGPVDAVADTRSEARTHYQSGVKFYNTGNYKSAIREFSQAQTLAPADLNNYNLALCYDKLGEPEPAMEYYRAYLDKVPNTDKRAEIQASMARLGAAAKSVAAKRAEEARLAEEARKAIEAKRLADEAKRIAAEVRKAEEEAAAKAKLDEEARKAEQDRTPPIGPVAPIGVGSTGTPGTGTVSSTGDAQLDRVSQIDINQIRDHRVGGASSGIADRNMPPAKVGSVGGGAGAVGTGDPDNATNDNSNAAARRDPNTNPSSGQPKDPATPTKATPVYKKWWFWAVVGVSAYVLYTIATDDSTSSNARSGLLLPIGGNAPAQPGGMTLMRW